MSNDTEKKGLFGRLVGKKAEKGSCCGGYRIEPIADDEAEKKPETGKMAKAEECKNNNCCSH